MQGRRKVKKIVGTSVSQLLVFRRFCIRKFVKLDGVNFYNSQMLPEQWSTMDKVTADKIKANGMKGDFMSILQRRQPVILPFFIE
jgi:hypothetical protein